MSDWWLGRESLLGRQNEWHSGVVEWVKWVTVRWLGRVIRMNEDDSVKREFEGRIDGEGIRGRSPNGSIDWMSIGERG